MPRGTGFGGGGGSTSSGGRGSGFSGGSSSKATAKKKPYTSTPAQSDKSFKDQALRTGGGILLGALKVLDAPRAAVDKLNTLGPKIGPKQIGGGQVRAGNLIPGLGQLALVGQLRDDNPKGIAGFARNFAVDVAQDPLTYVSFGAGAGAKQGLKVVAKELGPDVAKEVVEKGARKALTPAARQQLRTAIVAGEGGSEKAATRVLRALDKSGQGGVKVAGRTVVPGKTFRPVTEPLADAKRSLLGTKAAQAVVPRAAIAARFGPEIAETVGGASSRARALAAREADATVREIERAVKASGATKDELARIVLPALDVGGDPSTLPPRLVPLFDTLVKVRQAATDKQVAAGVLPALRQTDTYVPLDLTKRGRRALQGDQALAERFGMMPDELQSATAQGGHVKQRTLMPDRSVRDVDAIVGGKLRAKGALKGDLVEQNPAILIARRAAQADKAVAHSRFVDEVAQLTDRDGLPLLVKAADGVDRPAGYVTITDAIGGKLYAPAEIADEIAKVREIITNDEALREFQGVLGSASTWWKAWATAGSLVTGGTGYFARNATGNVWANFVAGVKNPRVYERAARIQSTVAAKGVDGLSAADRRVFDLAEKHGVLGGSFSLAELTNPAKRGGRLGRAASDQKARRAVVAANPFNTENVAIRSGRRFNEAIENNARLAHFLSKLDELGSAEEAANSVRKWLFDYGDKAPIDRTAAKFAGFYTWIRKTVPTQLEGLARQPGKFTGLAHAQLGAMESAAPQDAPQWAIDEGLVPVGDGEMMAGLDLPPWAVADVFEPSADNVVNRFGGLLPSLGKAVVEEQTGKSLFTGGNVKGSFAKRLADAGMPFVGKVERSPLTARLTGDPQADARLLGVTGLTTRNVAPKATAEEKAKQRGRGFGNK